MHPTPKQGNASEVEALDGFVEALTLFRVTIVLLPFRTTLGEEWKDLGGIFVPDVEECF